MVSMMLLMMLPIMVILSMTRITITMIMDVDETIKEGNYNLEP